MAVIIDKPKSQKKLIVILVLAFAATAAVLYFGFGEPAIKKNISGGANDLELIPVAGALKWDFPIFNDERFKTLKSYAVPIEVKNKGRANPFIPYKK